MANHPSAQKRHRQSLKRAARNQTIRSGVRTAVKKARTALQGNDPAAATEVAAAARVLQKAASKGVLHKNNAARRTSRLARQAHKATQKAAQ